MITRGASLVGLDPSKVPRVGVIPRYTKDEAEMRWFDVPDFNILHATNAWDEEDTMVMVAPNFFRRARMGKSGFGPCIG